MCVWFGADKGAKEQNMIKQKYNTSGFAQWTAISTTSIWIISYQPSLNLILQDNNSIGLK